MLPAAPGCRNIIQRPHGAHRFTIPWVYGCGAAEYVGIETGDPAGAGDNVAIDDRAGDSLANMGPAQGMQRSRADPRLS